MKRFILLLLIASAGIFFVSCKENSYEKQRQNELKKLGEFMRAHYAGVTPRPTGLYFIPLEEGSGDSIRIGDRVQIFHETMTLDSGYVSRTGPYEPLEIIVQHPGQLSRSANSAGQTLALHEALTYMKKGSKARLIFDSSLGFGQIGIMGAPGFTSIIMEVEVYKHFPVPKTN